MKAGKNKVVSLSHILYVDGSNGAIIESWDESDPCEYIFGANDIWSKVEEELEGKEEGFEFSITIPPHDAYGDVNPSAIIDLEKNIFAIDGVVQEDILIVGKVLKMLNADGNHIMGKIVEINEDSVKMDFNHPFAGKSLICKGKIMAVREATETELEEGATKKRIEAYMAKHGGHGCGGGCCGGCGSDSGCGSGNKQGGCGGCH